MRDYRCLDGMIGNAESMLKMAYEKGYQQGQKDSVDCISEETNNISQSWYKAGVRDMFDAMYKLVAPVNKGGLWLHDVEEIFGTDKASDVMSMFSENPLLLIENIREYETRYEKYRSFCAAVAKAKENVTMSKMLGKYEVLECPFCGKVDTIDFADLKTEEICGNCEDDKCPCYTDDTTCIGEFVVCNFAKGGCGASGGWGWDKETAVANWNRRG